MSETKGKKTPFLDLAQHLSEILLEAAFETAKKIVAEVRESVGG